MSRTEGSDVILNIAKLWYFVLIKISCTKPKYSFVHRFLNKDTILLRGSCKTFRRKSLKIAAGQTITANKIRALSNEKMSTVVNSSEDNN